VCGIAGQFTVKSQLFGQNAGLNLHNVAILKIAKLERAIGNADQAADFMAKIFHDPADFPVFTFADGHCQPRIAWHLAVQCCDHLAIANAVNGHPIFQRN